MSNTTRYDALLVLHLARELNAVLAGQRLVRLSFDRADASLWLECELQTLRWTLRPNGRPAWTTEVAAGPELRLPKRATVAAIEALPDERVLRFAFQGGQRANAVHTLMVELLPTQANAVALDQEGRVLKQLFARDRSDRTQIRGQPYRPLVSRGRLGSEYPLSITEWNELLAPVPAAERERVVVARVAYTSPLNASAILQDAADDMAASHARYLELRGTPTLPCALNQPSGQPYPHDLWQTGTRAFDTLLEAFAASPGSGPVDAVTEVARRVAHARKRLEKLEAELATASEEAQRLRSDADLLLAHAHKVRRGSERIELDDFSGVPRPLLLDPAHSAIENAQSWYESARRRDRAAQRLPALVAAARTQVAELEELAQRAARGEPVDVPRREIAQQHRTQHRTALPYRRYRTTGGLEIRVGRNSRSNDELTMRHSSPNDIWLHVREAGGAHVVLRWADPEAPPPRRDLVEAATLAALHSKARHSRTVPVDWTRRKYVRKPRGAPPGQVRVERAETVFVEPDAGLEERLRDAHPDG